MYVHVNEFSGRAKKLYILSYIYINHVLYSMELNKNWRYFSLSDTAVSIGILRYTPSVPQIKCNGIKIGCRHGLRGPYISV